MKKKQEKQARKSGRERDAVDDKGALDWMPLLGATKDAIEWALDIAVRLCRDYPEEVERVESVRAALRAQLAGRPIERVPLEDVLFTFGLIISAIERDLGSEGLADAWLSTMGAALGANAVASPLAALRVPLSWAPQVRRCPGALAPSGPYRAPSIHFVI